MAVTLPQREFLTFLELQERWECTENDIRRMILSSRLVPSYLWNDPVNVVTFIEATQDGRRYWEHSQVPNDVEFDDKNHLAEFPFKSTFADGFYFLLFPWQTKALNCNFVYLSKDRSLTQQSGHTCLVFRRPKLVLTLDEVIEGGAVMMSEVLLFEGAGEAEIERPLGTRERDTLLTIIAVLAKAAKVGLDDYRKPGKAAGYIEGLTDDFGAHVSKRTIEDHLKKIHDALAARKK